MIDYEKLKEDNIEYIEFNENGVSGSIYSGYQWSIVFDTEEIYFNIGGDLDDSRIVYYSMFYTEIMDIDEDYEGEEITRRQFISKMRKVYTEEQVQTALDIIKETKKFMRKYFKED